MDHILLWQRVHTIRTAMVIAQAQHGQASLLESLHPFRSIQSTHESLHDEQREIIHTDMETYTTVPFMHTISWLN